MTDLAIDLGQRTTARSDWRTSLAIALCFTLSTRIFLTVYLATASILVPRPVLKELYANTGVPLLTTGWEGAILGVWQREDALWYEKIATVGYSITDGTQDRFPLYPLLMKIVTSITGFHPVASGIIVSEVSLILALFLLHRMVLAHFDRPTATRTIAYLALFPMAFFLHGPFSESLMLFLSVLGFYLLDRKFWILALPAAFLAGLTRPQGVLLGVALAIRWLTIGGDTGTRLKLTANRKSWEQASLLILASFAGLATFLLAVDTAWRGPAFAADRGLWASQSLALPGRSVIYAVQRITQGTAFPIDIFDFCVLLLFAILTFAAFRRLPAGWAAYSVLFLLAPLARYNPTFPLMSLSRYVLVLFPCFIVLAQLGEHKRVHLAITFIWLSGLGFWSAIFYTGSFVG